MTQHCRNMTSPTRRCYAAAFTLIELLVVIVIMVLVMVMAVPTFNALSGNRSTEAAYNQVSATLATARTDAIYNHVPTGLMFYMDPNSGREMMAEVATTSTTAPYILNLAFGRDPLPLQRGVGVQLIVNNVTGLAAGAGGNQDRYEQTGVILFDSTGRMRSIEYTILGPQSPAVPGYELGTAIGLNTSVTFSSANPTLAYSQVGMVFYDRPAFIDQGFSDAGLDFYTYFSGQSSPSNEATKDTWLDTNGTLALINQATGALVKGK